MDSVDPSGAVRENSLELEGPTAAIRNDAEALPAQPATTADLAGQGPVASLIAGNAAGGPGGGPRSAAPSAAPSAGAGASLYENLRRGLVRTVSPESRTVAREMDNASLLRRAAPLRKVFVRGAEGTQPPMSKIYQGGRSGTVALKVYLAVVWRCSRAPYSTTVPARALAELLDLEDPEGRGARRVSDALRQLAAANLITLTPQPGMPNLITLLDESGDGSPYVLPSTAYQRAPNGARGDAIREHNRYFLVPNQLWLDGDIQELDGPGIVLLLILLAEQGGEGKPVWFATKVFHSRYNISAKTRSEGRRQLERLHLLTVDREPVSLTGSTFDLRRRRNIYHLHGPALAATFRDPQRQAAASAPLNAVPVGRRRRRRSPKP